MFGMSFVNHVAIITGAASGIGRALADELTRRRALVIGADVQFGDGNPDAVRLDVRDAAALQQLVNDVMSRHGRLDLMFNNAGVAVSGEIRDLTLDQWRT